MTDLATVKAIAAIADAVLALSRDLNRGPSFGVTDKTIEALAAMTDAAAKLGKELSE